MGNRLSRVNPLGRLIGTAAGSGANQGLAGDLDQIQILPIHQRKQASGHDGGDGNRSAEAFRYGQRQVLQHQGIAGTEGRAAEGCS